MKIYMPIVKNIGAKLNPYFNGYSISQNNNLYSLTNVSPGPAKINPITIEKICNEISNKNKINKYVYGNTPLEMSHRSPEFNIILENLNKKIKNLMEIPDDFTIIWTQAGGHGQFSSIPLNMNRIFHDTFGCYAVTGTWSSRAYEEAKKFIRTKNITEDYYKNINNTLEYNDMPLELNIPKDADYLYICSNETVNGIEFKNDGISYPDREKLGKTKLVVDMSSDFLMKKINWKNIDVAFACTSKNMGVAGANILIIKKNLLNKIDKNKNIPCVLDWKAYEETNSLYNTPAVFNLYLLDHILDDYIEKMENIENVEIYNKKKAQILYDFLDNNANFYCCVKDKKLRSNVNIPFIVGNGNSEIRNKFLDYCYKHNVVGLRTQTPFSYESLGIVEPLRISLYNGITIEDVKYIVSLMKEFNY